MLFPIKVGRSIRARQEHMALEWMGSEPKRKLRFGGAEPCSCELLSSHPLVLAEFAGNLAKRDVSTLLV